MFVPKNLLMEGTAIVYFSDRHDKIKNNNLR